MSYDHIEHDDIEHRQLADKIKPGALNEYRHEERDCSPIIGQHVGPLHKRQRGMTNELTDRRAKRLARLQAKADTETCHLRIESLLNLGIVPIEPERQLAHRFCLERYASVVVSYRLRIIEFTSTLPIDKEEMELAVMVGHSCLNSMADCSSDGEGPYANTPLRLKAKSNTKIYRSEPDVTRHTIKNTPKSGIAFGHPCQLTIGTVANIGQDK